MWGRERSERKETRDATDWQPLLFKLPNGDALAAVGRVRFTSGDEKKLEASLTWRARLGKMLENGGESHLPKRSEGSVRFARQPSVRGHHSRA